MNSTEPKPSNRYFFWIIAAFALWLWCFRLFLSQELSLREDAFSYYNHIKFYIDQLMKGVYPLWNPYFSKGVLNEFFLRRFGSFNPFFGIIILLRWIGVSHLYAYMTFLSLYWFLGMLGFYMLARSLVRHPVSAYTAFLILCFSSLATRLFDSYILFVSIPLIWFFAFMVRFFQTQKPVHFLGMTLTLMILGTTYIPLYFALILLMIGFVFALIFPDKVFGLIQIKLRFLRQHKWVTMLCLIALLCSVVPGIQLFLSARSGAFAMPVRNHQAEAGGHALAVAKTSITNWAILEEMVYSAAFNDLTQFKFAVIYFPSLALIIFVLGFGMRWNRKILFYFIAAMLLFLIGTPGLTGMYDALYANLFIFKYFRNLHWFLWLAIIPLCVLFVAEEMDQLIQVRLEKKRLKIIYAFFLIGMHILFYVLIQQFGEVLPATTITICLSLAFWLALNFKLFRENSFFMCACIFAIVAVQVVPVYQFLNTNTTKFSKPYRFDLPYDEDAFQRLDLFAAETKSPLYYALKPYNQAYNILDFEGFKEYAQNSFYVYDVVYPVSEHSSKFPWDKIDDVITRQLNLAVVQLPAEVKIPLAADSNGQRVQRMTEDTRNFHLITYQPNKVEFETEFAKDKFFVFVNTFHSGWKAKMNGKKIPIFQTNGAFQGIYLPAGKRHVQFSFGDGGLLLWNQFLLFLNYGMLLIILMFTFRSFKHE